MLHEMSNSGKRGDKTTRKMGEPRQTQDGTVIIESADSEDMDDDLIPPLRKEIKKMVKAKEADVMVTHINHRWARHYGLKAEQTDSHAVLG